MRAYSKPETKTFLPGQSAQASQSPTRKMGSENLRNMMAMTNKLGLNSAPAAWPTGVSLLAQAVDACQRCDATEVCGDWLKRAPDKIEQAPAFCANVDTFSQAKKATER